MNLPPQMRPAGIPPGRAPMRLGRRVVRTAIATVLYGGFSWLVITLAGASLRRMAFPVLFMVLLVAMLSLGFVLAVALAWQYGRVPSRDERS